MKKTFFSKLTGLIIIAILAVLTYENSVYIPLYKYVYLYNTNNYEKIIPCFVNIAENPNLNEERLIEFLKQQKIANGNIKVKANILKTKNTVLVPVTYEGKPNRNDALVFTRNEKTNEWKVRFPYKRQKTQKKPVEKEVKQEVKQEMNLQEEINELIKEFNNKYIEAIVEKDTSLIEGFIIEGKKAGFIKEFTTWYIDDKNISSADSSMDIKSINKHSPNAATVSVLEKVVLTNDEGKEDTPYMQDYKIVILWDYQIIRYNSSLIINQRQLVQSIISYKDENNEWISY